MHVEISAAEIHLNSVILNKILILKLYVLTKYLRLCVHWLVSLTIWDLLWHPGCLSLVYRRFSLWPDVLQKHQTGYSNSIIHQCSEARPKRKPWIMSYMIIDISLMAWPLCVVFHPMTTLSYVEGGYCGFPAEWILRQVVIFLWTDFPIIPKPTILTEVIQWYTEALSNWTRKEQKWREKNFKQLLHQKKNPENKNIFYIFNKIKAK